MLFSPCVVRVSKPPQNLDELGDSLSLWEKLHSEQAAIEAKFQPLHDQFAILEKYEVAIPEQVSQQVVYWLPIIEVHVH